MTAPKTKEQDPYNWKQFWWRELRDMKIRTGINQWEKFKEQQPKGLEDVRILVAQMTAECERTPFNWLRKDVVQRVIHNEVVEDTEFIGFSVKWVRKALNKWWAIHGDKIIIERQRLQDEEAERNKPETTINPHEDVHTTVENYRRRLLFEAEAAKKTLPRMKPEVAAKEGAEWKSDLERKGIIHSNGYTQEYVEMRDKLQREGSEFYKDRSDYRDMRIFEVNEFPIFAASEKDAIEIYTAATKVNTL